jgi:hypothetical protein
VLPECYVCIAMPGVVSRPIEAAEAESWLMAAVRVRNLPPVLQRFVDLIGDLNRAEVDAPKLVPSRAVNEHAKIEQARIEQAKIVKLR